MPSGKEWKAWKEKKKKKRLDIGIEYATGLVENIERGKESGERAANNGRQPKHPINLTGPGPQAPRGFKLSHPKTSSTRAQPLHYVTLAGKREPCRVPLLQRGPRVAKEEREG